PDGPGIVDPAGWRPPSGSGTRRRSTSSPRVAVAEHVCRNRVGCGSWRGLPRTDDPIRTTGVVPAPDPARGRPRVLREEPLVDEPVALREAAEDDALDAVDRPGRIAHGRDRDLRGELRRVAVDARADAREGDRAQRVFGGDLEGVAVARGEELGLARGTAAPHGPDGVDHVARRQPVAPGDAHLAGRAAAEAPALLEQLGTRGAVDRAVDAASTEERRIRGVDDRVDGERRDVRTERLELRRHAGVPVS